jgi:HEAT repeat protein
MTRIAEPAFERSWAACARHSIRRRNSQVLQPPLRSRTLEACLRDVDDRNPAVRASAVRDLAAHVDTDRPSVIGALERALRDGAAEVRSAAAIALADGRGVEVLGALLFAIEDDDPFVRQMAIAAVGETRDQRAREHLRKVLGDQRPEVRFQAVIAFARVAPDEADAVISSALGDADPAVRYVAIRVAEERGEEGSLAQGGQIVQKLGALLEDPDVNVRAAAAIALGRAGDSRGASTLLDVVSRRVRVREADDEAAAIELVGEIELRAATPYLVQRAFGFMARLGREAFSFQALVALARLGHQPARARIIGDLGARSRDRRTLAVAAAGRARLIAARPLIEAMRGDETRAEQDAVADALEALVRGTHLQFSSPERDLP